MGIAMEAIDMPFNKHGIRPDIIMNPNAVPSRMTIGQLCECLLGKIGALKGMNMDGTAFEDYDLEALKDMLEKLGYQRNCEEYLYNGMTGKKMKHMIFFGPTYYQRLKHLVIDKIHCVDGETDVLTSDGWKNIKDVTMSDKVATLVKGELVYENPTNLMEYPDYEGEIYRVQNDNIDLVVTANHRMWVSSTDENAIYGFELARDIIGKTRTYKQNADWNNFDFTTDSFDDAEQKYDMNEIIEIIARMIKLENTKSDVCVTLPKWMWDLSKKQCQLLIEKTTNTNGDYLEFCTLSSKLKDDIQRLSLHAGYISKSNYQNNIWIVYIYTNPINTTVNKDTIDDKMSIEKCPVFCLTVPSGVFYVRRNGKTVWTGNSRSRGPVTMLTHQAAEGRSRDGGLRLGKINPFRPRATISTRC